MLELLSFVALLPFKYSAMFSEMRVPRTSISRRKSTIFLTTYLCISLYMCVVVDARILASPSGWVQKLRSTTEVYDLDHAETDTNPRLLDETSYTDDSDDKMANYYKTYETVTTVVDTVSTAKDTVSAKGEVFYDMFYTTPSSWSAEEWGFFTLLLLLSCYCCCCFCRKCVLEPCCCLGR